MKVENDLRTMSSFLQVQLKYIKTLVESNKIDQAKENLKFVQGGLNNFANELEKVEGGFYGIIGFLFRRPYKVPDDLKNIRENLFIEAKTLQKELDKQSEKENNNKNRLSARAIKALKSGQLAILPTETVYGLFADAMNEEAVQKLYSVKGRPTEKALNMNISSFEDILKYSINQPVYLQKIVEAFLPGPLTIILEASKDVSEWIHIGKSTVGFRMPNIAVTQKIIKEVGVLVGPSANLSGSKSPSFFADLSPEILENAAVAVQDDSIYGLDTTIIDLTQEKPKLLRQGAVTKEELLKKVPELGQIE
ncbi:threonylcarbamoyl-AMP synthase [Lactococcus lactis]|nr:L-threonylcarbamoyladenylate synthase [Lactococcus lactis]TRW75073.1 threonylcarbamoyl-AMP synthase [Lactococcus lactis]